MPLFFGSLPYSCRCGDAYLTGALGAAVHRPLIFVLVHNAIMDADATVAVYLSLQ